MANRPNSSGNVPPRLQKGDPADPITFSDHESPVPQAKKAAQKNSDPSHGFGTLEEYIARLNKERAEREARAEAVITKESPEGTGEAELEALFLHPLENFRIFRLIRNTDKAGQERQPPFDISHPRFTVNYGDYLLRLDNEHLALTGQFRNMAGQEGGVPIRMTQKMFMPWGLPGHIPLVEDGEGLPIVFSKSPARDAAGNLGISHNEALFGGFIDPNREEDKAEQDPKVVVMDVDRRTIKVRNSLLETRYKYPWNLRVHFASLNDAAREELIYAADAADERGAYREQDDLRRKNASAATAKPASRIITQSTQTEKAPNKIAKEAENSQPVISAADLAILEKGELPKDWYISSVKTASAVFTSGTTRPKTTVLAELSSDMVVAKEPNSTPAPPDSPVVDSSTGFTKSRKGYGKRVTRGILKRNADEEETVGVTAPVLNKRPRKKARSV